MSDDLLSLVLKMEIEQHGHGQAVHQYKHYNCSIHFFFPFFLFEGRSGAGTIQKHNASYLFPRRFGPMATTSHGCGGKITKSFETDKEKGRKICMLRKKCLSSNLQAAPVSVHSQQGEKKLEKRVVFRIFVASNGCKDSKTERTMNALERQFAQTVEYPPSSPGWPGWCGSSISKMPKLHTTAFMAWPSELFSDPSPASRYT